MYECFLGLLPWILINPWLLHLFTHFWNNFRHIESINRYLNVINGSKNVKCEFCVKIFYQEYREIARKLKYHLPIVWNKCLLTENIWYYKIIFSSTTPMLLPKLSFMNAKGSCKFEYLYSSCVYSESDDAVSCINFAIFLSTEKQSSFASFVNKV